MPIKYLWFETSRICNSRCGYCNIWKTRDNGERQLTPKQLYLTLTDPMFKNVCYVINSGGEPTLQPKLLDFLEVEHKACPNARLQLSTNGLLPERVLAVARAMSEIGCRLDVGLSLDGVGEEHDRIRGVKENFEKVEYLFQELPKYANVAAGATLTLKNYKANIRAFEYAKEHGIPFIFHWLNSGSFYKNTATELKDVKRIASAVGLMQPSLYRSMWLNHLKGKPLKFRCKTLRDFLVLKLNGDVAPCLSHWDMVVGNVFDKSPSAILKGVGQYRKRLSDCVCLNNWGVKWSLTKFQRYFWKGKEILKENF